MAEQHTKTVDERFDEVTQGFLDHRDYATFVYDKLSARFDKVDGRLDKVDARFDNVDGRLGRIELVLSEVLNEVKALSSR